MNLDFIRILIIEDNAVTRKVVMEGLKNYAFEVIEAENGTQGVEFSISYEPDVILLDLNLPDIDGFKVLEMLRKNPKTMFIPVIIITVSATSEDVQKAILYGIKSYVVKPIKIDDLINRISKVLKIPLNELKRQKGSKLLILYPGIEELNVTEYLGKKVKKVSVSELEEGMKIGIPLYKDKLGKEILYKAGVPLNEKRIQSIQDAGFEWIYVIEEELEEHEENLI
ncbi:MAG: response regulator [Brevinematia bacterium]